MHLQDFANIATILGTLIAIVVAGRVFGRW